MKIVQLSGMDVITIVNTYDYVMAADAAACCLRKLLLNVPTLSSADYGARWPAVKEELCSRMRRVQSRGSIVGGRPTSPNKYPWVARLVYEGRFHCGASLVNNDYVLTAAHCVRRWVSDFLRSSTHILRFCYRKRQYNGNWRQYGYQY